MTTRRRGRRSSGSRRQVRRQNIWIDTLLNQNTTSGAQTLTSLTGSLTANQMAGMTLERLLLRMDLGPNGDQAAYGFQSVDLGVQVTTVEAFSAGVVPDPGTAADQPNLAWVWRDSVGLQSITTTGVELSVKRIEADIRSKRRLGRGGELSLAVDSVSLAGTAFVIKLSGLVRVLFKLA